jgi:hypothetical protein
LIEAGAMLRRLASTLLLVAVGCGPTDGDARDDSFGGKDAKEDGGFSTCQLAEVLKLVNESTTTEESLRGLGLSDDAASGIVSHRHGPDGMAGTGDDDVFDDLDELDAVDFVGGIALGKLVFGVATRCEDDLASRPFIDDKTFTGDSDGFARDNAEVEVVLGVQGITGQRLRELLLQKSSSGRTLYERMRKSPAMEAFTYGFPLDEIPWTSDAQAAREKMPLVALTIESERFAVNDEGVRELSLGTDLNDDTYYDTNAFTLFGNDVELRGRARWDNATTVRRLLIAAKFGTEIDADGNKVNTKVDIRTDSGTSHLATLDDDVRRGKTSWFTTDDPAIPIRGVYEQLKTKNLLLDFPNHKGVLLLEPKAHLRSTRSRYHMNEVNVNAIKSVHALGKTRMQQALDVIARARAAGRIPSSEVGRINAIEAMANGILDKTLIASRLGTVGVDISASALVLPDTWKQPTDAAGLERNRLIAETVSALYHELADQLDDADRILTDAVDEDFDAFVDMFRAWRVSLDTNLAKKTTFDAFLALHGTLPATAIAEFNTFGAAQQAAGDDTFDDFAPLDAAGWARLGRYLEKRTLTIGERQLATAGLAARMLWFDQAREHWVPDSSRAFSNFMIDTTDFTDYLSHEEWTSIPEAERTFAAPLPAAKVFHTTLVNELQIELGMEEEYVGRLRTLTEQLAADPGNAELTAQLEGARFVWAQYTGAMKVLTELKGANVIDRLRRAGAPQGIKWSAPPDSKGNTALRILSDRD